MNLLGYSIINRSTDCLYLFLFSAL